MIKFIQEIFLSGINSIIYLLCGCGGYIKWKMQMGRDAHMLFLVFTSKRKPKKEMSMQTLVY